MIFIYDTAPRRDWSGMFGARAALVRWEPRGPGFQAARFVSAAEGAPILGPALVVLHPEPAEATLASMDEVAARDRLHLVTISGGDRHGAPPSPSPRITRRARAVLDLDVVFARAALRVADALASGVQPRHSELEPPPWPRPVLGAYLIARAATVGATDAWSALVQQERFEPLWEEVWLTFTGYGGDRARWTAVGLTDDALPDADPADAALVLSSIFPDEDRDQRGVWFVAELAAAHVRTRGALRHSWLENEVLARRPAFVARSRARASAARDAFDARIAPGGEFEARLRDARALADIFDALIDYRAALRALGVPALDQGALDDCQRALAAAAREATDAPRVQRDLRVACDAVEAALGDLRMAWAEGVEAGVEAAFTALQRGGSALHAALGPLPRGLVVP